MAGEPMNPHALAEAYAVLTRLPAPHRLAPADALAVLEGSFLEVARVVALDVDGYRSVLRRAGKEGISGAFQPSRSGGDSRHRPFDRIEVASQGATAPERGGNTLRTASSNWSASKGLPSLTWCYATCSCPGWMDSSSFASWRRAGLRRCIRRSSPCPVSRARRAAGARGRPASRGISRSRLTKQPWLRR